MPARARNTFPTPSGSGFKTSPLEQARVLFVSFVQGLFAAAPPGEYHWDPDPQKTEIIIRDENPIHVEVIGKRPAINFSLGPVQFYHMGMDDLLEYKFSMARKDKGILIPGTMGINVCSRVDIEAHNLAWIVAEHIWLLRDLFMKRGFFELGRGIQITPPSNPGSIVQGDSADEWYCSTVSVPWQFSRTSALTPLGRTVINNMELALSLNDPKRVESLGWPSSNTADLPASVHEFPPAPFAPAASDLYGTPDPAGLKDNPLPKQPHPLDPAKQVIVKVVRPNRAGLRNPRGVGASTLPIDLLNVEKSGGVK